MAALTFSHIAGKRPSLLQGKMMMYSKWISYLTFAGTRFFATLVWPRGVKLPPSVSRLLWYLGKKFQRLPRYFQGPGIQWSYSLYCVMQAEVRNPRWRLTNKNTYISACTQRSDKIPTAISMLSGSRNSMKLFLILCYASGSQKSKMAAHKYRKYSYLSLYTT